MAEPLPVLIAGAGPSGLVAALTLAQNGIKIRLIDKVEIPHVGSRGAGVQPRTCELFQTLGLLEDVHKYSTPIPTMRAYELPGGTVPIKTWNMFTKAGKWPDRPFGNGICLAQDQLEAILKKHLASYGVVVEYGKGLVGIQQTAATVTATVATFKDGEPADEQEMITAQYLLGTDGAKGVSRKLLGMTFQGETHYADGMVFGDVEIDGLTNDYWHVWGKPGAQTIMARPISPDSNKFGLGITGMNLDTIDILDEEKIKEFVIKETGRTGIKFGKFTWLSHFKPNIRIVNKFQEGRAFIAGDAGHVHPPTGGQGLNCSVQDAANIAWKLSLVLKGLSPPSLLETYNEERLPVIAHTLKATGSLLTHIKASAKPKAPVEPESSTEIATEDDDRRTGWFRWRNNALEMYGINYRFSDIVLDERDTQHVDREDLLANAYDGYEGLGTLVAGDRAPQAPGLVDKGGKETTLFDLFKLNLHTVLMFVRERAHFDLESAKKWPVSVVQTFVVTESAWTTVPEPALALVDTEKYAATAYRLEKDSPLTVVVVRPDGFVGAIVKDIAGADRYFAKIFKA